MLHIKKGSPPYVVQQDITRVKNTPPRWASICSGDTMTIRAKFDALDKHQIREALLVEQHHLCAYCMKHIKNDGISMSIEHFHPLSCDKENALNYSNFLGVCKGGSTSTASDVSYGTFRSSRILCCDASKGNETELTINPFNEQMMQCIAYYKDGRIYFNNTSKSFTPAVVEAIERDINDILCLNGKNYSGTRVDTATCLLKGRKDAYKKAQTIIQHLDKKGKLSYSSLESQIKRIEEDDTRPEFAGVIIFFLRRAQKRLSHKRS